MNRTGKCQVSIRRCTPVGTIADAPVDIAAAIRKRLDTGAAHGGDAYLTVFVEAGDIYATRATSPISARVRHAQLIGLYTHRAAANDIADDVAAWTATA